MKALRLLLLVLGGFSAAPAIAGEQLKFGPAPNWVVERPVPAKVPTTDQNSPFQVLLTDQQTRVEPDKTLTFASSALKIQTPDGLQIGNVSLPWDPARQTITIHKLHILRDGKIIDVLASQQFSTLRREQNLEAAMLDGVLTANIQPEGLQVGDVLLLSTTTEDTDPVMKGHAEIGFGNWDMVPIASAHARISWKEGVRLQFRSVGGLPEGRTTSKDGQRVFEIAAVDLQPFIPPKQAPARFRLGRQGEATTFNSWSEVADLMRPLYQSAAVIPKAGALRDELEKIRAAAQDPVQRAEKALDLVEHRVRYVALLMGQAGYVPATAEATWSQRFGDCKAKSALLLALLTELGISAEPVLVNIGGGDGLDQRLPMAGHFNHVIVRAQIAGKTYWLDGTRKGDAKLATLETPYYHWGLPLVSNAKLVAMVPDRPKQPQSERIIRIDASNGVYAPVPMTAEQILRGDMARRINTVYAAMTSAQRTESMRQYWQEQFTYLKDPVIDFKYDRDAADLRMTAKGNAKLEWDDGWFYVPGSQIGYDPAFDRPPGPLQDAPVAIGYPSDGKTVTEIRLPQSFITAMRASSKLPPAVDERIAGVHYFRRVAIEGDRLIMEAREQALTPELPYREAVAAAPRLKQINNDEINLRVPSNYVATKADLAARTAEKPTDLAGFTSRGLAFLASGQFELAVADLNEAVRLDPKNAELLSARSTAKAFTRDFAGAEADNKAAQRIKPNAKTDLQSQYLLSSMRGDFKGSIKLLDQILALDPKNRTALRNRAYRHIALRDAVAAEQAIAALQSAYSDDEELPKMRAGLAMIKDSPKAAIDLLSNLITKEPTKARHYLSRAEAFVSAGDASKALSDLDQALKLEPGNADARLARANALRSLGEREAVIKEADLMLSNDPKSSFPIVAAARIYAAYGLHEKAMQAFERALAVKPEAFIYLNRAQSRRHSDRQEALADVERALKLEPDSVDAFAIKARMLVDSGDPAGAAQVYERLEKLSPDSAEYYRIDRAVALHKSGNTTVADKLLADARKVARTAQQFNHLCWSKATAAILLQSALEDCREAVRLGPQHAAFHDSLGMALLRSGRLDEAVAAYDSAIAKSKKAPAASYMGRALAYARKGDLKKAEADAAEARKTDPAIDEEFERYGLRLKDMLATK